MEEGYVVERILDKRINAKGKEEYLVKWMDYPISQSTWEPVKNLEYVSRLIKVFEEKLPNGNLPQKTHPIHKGRIYGKISEQSHEERSENSKLAQPVVRKRGRPPKNKSISSVSSEIRQQIEIKSSSEPQESLKQNSVIQVQPIQAEPQASESFSDTSDTIQVVEMRLVAGVRYFQVKFPNQIKWMSNENMRKYYPRELILFYEKYITVN